MTTMHETSSSPVGQPSILEQITLARTLCRELSDLLIAENQGLSDKRVDAVEGQLQQKRRLTLRLEMTLQDLKQRRSEWHGRPAAQDVALRLAEEVGAFQTLAAKNMELLRAAYQLRADMVSIIRDTLDARAPRVQTYGRNGAMAGYGGGYGGGAAGGTRVVNRDV